MSDSQTAFPAGKKRIPRATYRCQFNESFTFRQATEVLQYLRELGVSDCYASPWFQARKGSTHGYDVCCFNTLNPQLGSAGDFQKFAAQIREFGMGLLLDIVPNHMGADLSNKWWFDVLEHGPASPYAGFFDINWKPCTPGLRNKLLLPVLGDHLGTVLRNGELQLSWQHSGFSIDYYDKKFPVSLAGYDLLLSELRRSIQATNPQSTVLKQLGLINDPSRSADAVEALNRAKKSLSAVFNKNTELRAALDSLLTQFNGVKGKLETFAGLQQLLDQQHYKLAFWKVGSEEINYRRFFDVTELASVKMESPRVFAEAHRLTFELLRAGTVTGLRVDHPDGMWNPRAYLMRLQEAFAHQKSSPASASSLYLLVEKILSEDEKLPADWPVDGTTGYDFLNQLNGLFVDSRNAVQFDRIYRELTGNHRDFQSSVYLNKKKILENSLISEINELAHLLKSLSESATDRRDFTWSQLRTVLIEVIAAFPVYRTYMDEQTSCPAETEKAQIETALGRARRRSPELEPTALEFLRRVLLLQSTQSGSQDQTRERAFVMKFQQLTGPATAKGLEDTTFYQFNRLVSLNEVGGSPDVFGIEPKEFHTANQNRLQHWPHSLLATATHDTKRGEDVRARINVLSEFPGEWRDAVKRWSNINARLKVSRGNTPAPSANDEYLLYQTLIGAWPMQAPNEELTERIAAYMLKAAREAKTNTTWTEPNASYESGFRDFVIGILEHRPFLADFEPFQRKIAFFGFLNSLSQTLLKLTCPGVPDIYQGCELWDLSLVDPDNRRPIDYNLRMRYLDEIKNSNPAKLVQRFLAEYQTGQIKLFTLFRALAFRREHEELFQQGAYIPLSVTGSKADHVCAFSRRLDDQEIIVAVPRLCATLFQGKEELPMGTVWEDTSVAVPDGTGTIRYRNLFTDEELHPDKESSGISCETIFAEFPVALLTRFR